MNTKHIAALLVAAFQLSAPALVHAQANAPLETTPLAMPLTEGEIKRVDLDAGKLTIKHGPIRNLDMPGMTMVFVAKDSTHLVNLKPGDKIRFVATNESGKFFASDIQSGQ